VLRAAVSAAFVGGSAAWIHLVPDTRDGWAVAFFAAVPAAVLLAAGVALRRRLRAGS
jgi:hypothetical protein